jgi:hypothetical protein
MSKNLSSVAQIQFDSMVKQAFQTAGKLRNTVTIRNAVVGDTYKFRSMGKGLATQRTAPSADVIPMDVAHSLITCSLTNWDADEYTDIFDKAEVNFDEMSELSTVISSALGRRVDQLIIDSLIGAGSYAGTVTVNDGGTNTGMNMAKLRKAKRYMDDKGVPMEGRTMLLSAAGLESLLGETPVTSADYNSVKALVNGEINSFVGFNFITIETRTEGGLTLSTNTRDGFAYHKDAVGMAIGLDISTKVDYIPQKKSWLSAGQFKGGAVARDTDGIVKVQSYEA